MESVIGEITKELAELKKTRKHNETEYERNRMAVAHFRAKYSELADRRKSCTSPGSLESASPRVQLSVATD